MAHGKSPKQSKNVSNKPKHGEKEQTWVDQLNFRPVQDDQEICNNAARSGVSLSVISWNVLAESYCSRRSHPGLPRQYQEVVFEPFRRGSVMRQILTHQNLRPDIWALQEVDLDEVLTKHLQSVGYEGVETPRMKLGAGAGGKVDSCGIYYFSDKWTLLDQELIRLDDLATMVSEEGAIPCINNNLRGLQQSFLRRNVALLCRLQSKSNPNTEIVVANAHLFWNPLYEYVKLCQIHYIMTRAKDFLKTPEEPLLLCGDLNSLPGNSVHTYLTKGVVNARPIAPWYQLETSEPAETSSSSKEASSIDGITNNLDVLSLVQNPSSRIRYLLDYNLNRLCRWFRILGLDAGLETEEEEGLRTKKSDIRLFDRCRQEKRVLVTTSNSLLARQNCPPGTYLVNPKSLSNNWEIVLVHILLTHGVHINPSDFLTRCVVCNGNICAVEDDDSKRKIFSDHHAPLDGTEELDVYQCDGCQQGYWFSNRPRSSANRVKGQASRLYQMCLRANVAIAQPIAEHMFEHVNVEEERALGWDWSMPGSELLKLRLKVTEWLKQDRLENPIPSLHSAYRDVSAEEGESLPFTNVTRDFEGCLDYIFFDKRYFQLVEQLYVPTSYEELNAVDFSGGQLLPSNVWPSDHLAIGASFVVHPIENR